MFVQIVITKSKDVEGKFRLVFFDEKGVVFTEQMTDQQVAETIFISLQNLRPPKP